MWISSFRSTVARPALVAALPLVATACSSQHTPPSATRTTLTSSVTTSTGYLITPQTLLGASAQTPSMLFVADDGKIREVASPRPN